MNQFVPIFLGQQPPDVDQWPGAIPGSDTRAADTQKCIRAGGKHNDLEDVGLDTYHHTFFEMLGNWSFGDYFKKEAIDWAWELVTEVWKFPQNRLYATVYNPTNPRATPASSTRKPGISGPKNSAPPASIPNVHIVNGNKKDNFWMMGETGPCGPCREMHVDLTPAATPAARWSTRAPPSASRSGTSSSSSSTPTPTARSRRCPPSTSTPAWASNASPRIMQGTKNFTDFANAKISNYETDIFRPIFDELEKLSGKKIRLHPARSPAAPAIPSRRKSTSPSASSPTISAR